MKTLDWKNATPAQLNFWNLVNGLIAWATITPLYYEGLIAGSEFLVYDAAHLYIALELFFNQTPGAGPGAEGNVKLYAIGGVNINTTLSNNTATYDGVGAITYDKKPILSSNNYFTKIVATNYQNMKFNGYRLHT